MALSFDDRILGEKVNNYCSSSEDGEDSDSSNDDENNADGSCAPSPSLAPDLLSQQVARTGPKGVIADYKQYQRLKAEQDKMKEEMALQLAKKCALTSRSYNADQLAKQQEQQLKELFESLEDDDAFLVQYRQRRLAEMQGTLESLPTYGHVYELNASNFVHEIDKEPAQVTVVVHVFEEIANGVPAILVYKNKELIGNLISISRELDEDFAPEELETFLFEQVILTFPFGRQLCHMLSSITAHGFLPPKEDKVSPLLRDSSSTQCAPLDSDSD
ncbi:unnamed protein product [Mesocestoides corti]|uniref:Phosducin domain-containing protein n=1 Tax=Mesocestoides corti TaxID=53468 RepID=A0A0R3UGQ9_MESCO|nr:unnamed protein product [Mesocestoides corti]